MVFCSTNAVARKCQNSCFEKFEIIPRKKYVVVYFFYIHARDDNGWTVLHRVAQSGDLELFQYLIEHGSDQSSRTKNGKSSFHLSAEKGHLKICRLLLENYNFDIHARDDDDWDVLHRAAWSGDLELLQYLIENESDILSKAKDDQKVICILLLMKNT